MSTSKIKNAMKRLALSIIALAALSFTVRAQNYGGAWNTPTISHSSYPDKIYFGMTDAYDRRPGIDASTMPAIPGLKYSSCYVLCAKDTCYARRVVMAVRCPQKRVLLDWASKRAALYEVVCCNDPTGKTEPEKVLVVKSAGDICSQYIRRIEESVRQECLEGGMPGEMNEQSGFLLTDCWQTDKYCTFYQATWYDMLSCGDNTTQAYYSVDKKTGRVATLEDFVPKSRWPALAEILYKYLKNSSGKLWVDENPDRNTFDPMETLNDRSGCALIREGLVIYYFPYAIGGGYEGEIMAVIPHDKVTKLNH